MSMRRKSERNKAKGSPEKKVEKPTRKSTRRRGKRSPSTSPEIENTEETPAAAPTPVAAAAEPAPAPAPEPTPTPPITDGVVSQTEPENTDTTVQTRLQVKEVEQPQVLEVAEEKVTSSEQETKAQSPGDEEENNGTSVWKVARADASPGEIQKLKLCRQRNTSEASSEASVSRKKSSGKWQESGEGFAGEVDSADEQLVSCMRMPSGIEQPNDPSSSYPGQDSNEEVSDSKEILPETTSANLSDDKPNIDRQGDTNEACCSEREQNIDSEPGSKPSSASAEPAALRSNGDFARDTEETATVAVVANEDKPTNEDASEKSAEPSGKEEDSTENARRETSSDEDDTNDNDKRKERRSEDTSSESNDEARGKGRDNNRDSARTPSRTGRRKHRNKYRDSSNSETPDSEEEPSLKRKNKETYDEEAKTVVEDAQEEKEELSSPDRRANSVLNNMDTMEIEHSENDKQISGSLAEKAENTVLIGSQIPAVKPAKVNLKRSFSARILAERNDIKREETDTNANTESANQNKENHNSAEQEPKCAPRKRRWGTALSTDTAPSFAISTDSLKAIVPGAKPLPINEVRLSKDDDEDRDRHRDMEKRHNSTDSISDHKSKEDGLTQKNGATKKGDSKLDNHIAARRKISIVKETPHLKSPSPPASKPTNILLIKNLVRPFTLNQIKELLSRTGTIVENGFWMDRIKSKCFVEYSNEDQAFETRQALHGISWPVSNPKRLYVEYATKEDIELARELSKDQPVQRKTEPLMASDSWQQDWGQERANSTKVVVVREWDLGKEDGQQHVKEKERDKKEHDKKRRQRSRSPALEAHLPAPARKFKKKEDEPPPAKLLDDLFRKTKATPCIYWLPLTNEQIVVKEEMRRQHMAEHARRLEEMRRAERNRDGRRRRSPRK